MVFQRRSGFSLVELLIAIAIISALGAIMLPAIQSSREAARLTSCRSNISQLSKGMIEHETFHGYFPSGGWSPEWLGMAERTGDSSQPGGWAFGVLPYIEELTARNIVANVPASGMNAAYGRLATTSLPTFACPSRRGSRSLALVDTSFQGGAVTLTKATRSDYAINSGSGGSAAAGFQGLCPRLSAYASAITVASKKSGSKKVTICHAPPGNPTKGNTLNISVSGLNGHQNHDGDMLGECDSCDKPVDAILSSPASVSEGDSWRKMSLADKLTNLSDMGIPDVIQDGIAGRMTRLQPASVYDGLSNTYLIGEKYVAADKYFSGTDEGDAAPMMAGYSSNTSRWGIARPARDAKGVSNPRAFGSAHRGGWNVAYADGMVRTVSFDIDATLHAQLSGRNDGKGMPPKD
jgi:prepilin-type N-terminal cleavage/methylation domain-containing protein